MNWFRRNHARPPRPKAAGRRPQVEALEDRMLATAGLGSMHPPVLPGGSAPATHLVTTVASKPILSGKDLAQSIYLLNNGDMLKARVDQLVNGIVIVQPIPGCNPLPPGGL
jgi:hypothetical protein